MYTFVYSFPICKTSIFKNHILTIFIIVSAAIFRKKKKDIFVNFSHAKVCESELQIFSLESALKSTVGHKRIYLLYIKEFWNTQ